MCICQKRKMVKILIAAILSTLIYGAEVAPVNNFHKNVCLELDSKDAVNPRGINDMLDDLNTRIDGIKVLSQQLKQYITDVFNCVSLIDSLNSRNFIDKNRYAITKNILSQATSDPVAAVQYHYALMYELVVHVNKILTDGQINSMTRNDYPSRNETLRDKLHHIQEKMYDVICSMKIALRGEGETTEHTVTQDVLSANFLRLNRSLASETYRAYILMNDCEGIMNYLKEIYTELANSRSNQTR